MTSWPLRSADLAVLAGYDPTMFSTGVLVLSYRDCKRPRPTSLRNDEIMSAGERVRATASILAPSG